MVEQNRRDRIASFYRRPQLLLEKTASSASQYGYHGEFVGVGTVVRVDLNGYSKWAKDRPIGERVALLSTFFSNVVPELESRGGVFFRDEGDCIVGLFSPYFGAFSFRAILDFARAAVGQTYGQDDFTAKATIVSGPSVAIFQKFHELGTVDWSAEGAPFVEAARIESAIDSKQCIYLRETEYDACFKPEVTLVGTGGKYFWYHDDTHYSVSGLGLAGGQLQVHRITYVPGGRTQ